MNLSSPRAFGWSLSLAMLVSVLAGGTASAQDRLRGVVLPFDGRGAARFEQQVAGALSDQEMVATDEARTAAARLGADLESPAGIARVAADLRLDFVVSGALSGSGRRQRLEIILRDASGGEVARRDGPVGRNPRVSEMVQELTTQGFATIRERRAQTNTSTTNTTATTTTPIDTPTTAPVEAGGPATLDRGVGMIVFTAGLDVRTRSARFVTMTGIRSYETEALYPELSGRLEVRPLVGVSDAAAGALAILEGGVSLGLSSRPDGMGAMNVSTTSYRFLGSLGYMGILADHRLHLGGLVGFGIDGFALGANSVVPSTAYPYLRLAGAVRIEILQEPRTTVDTAGVEVQQTYPTLAVHGEFGYRLGFDTGNAGFSFGQNQSISGFDFGIGLLGELPLGLTWLARFGFERWEMTFAGPAAVLPATRGEDQAVRLTLHLGWTIR